MTHAYNSCGCRIFVQGIKVFSKYDCECIDTNMNRVLFTDI